MSFWVSPNVSKILDDWSIAKARTGMKDVVKRPTTHRCVLTIAPSIALTDGPVKIVVEADENLKVFNHLDHKQLDNEYTRIIMKDPYNVTDIQKVLSNAESFGLLIMQGEETKRALLFPRMDGFQECYHQMIALNSESPKKAA